MAKIIINEDCSDVIQKQFLSDFSIALANRDINTVMSMVSGDVHVSVPGYDEASGKNAVQALLLEDAQQSDATELIIKNIISNGDRCVADGVWKFADGGEVAFCTIYTFTGHAKDAKIRDITTYAVVLTEMTRP